MTQEEVTNELSIRKQWKNVTGTVYDSHTKESGRITTEVSHIDNEDTFTWNLYDIHTQESGKISFRKRIKNV